MAVLLTRVECLCGTIAAIPEGGFFPLCGRCGRRMVCPLRGEPGDINNVLSYVAEMDIEPSAVKRSGGCSEAEWKANYTRWYGPEHLRAALEERGWPTEPQPWPEFPAPDSDGSATYAVPPWEVAT